MELRDIEKAVLQDLLRRKKWGDSYIPRDSLVNWHSKKVGRNGKRVEKAITSLRKREFILLHKKGNTISLNPHKKKEIIGFLNS